MPNRRGGWEIFDADGKFAKAKLKVYPPLMCGALASAIAASVLRTQMDEASVQRWLQRCNGRLLAHCLGDGSTWEDTPSAPATWR